MTTEERERPTFPGLLLLSERLSHANVMPNAAAKRANKPSATRWLADELEVELDFDPVALEELAEVGTGVPVATAPTPPVTGPWSEV